MTATSMISENPEDFRDGGIRIARLQRSPLVAGGSDGHVRFESACRRSSK
jgi:hypothetical protein